MAFLKCRYRKCIQFIAERGYTKENRVKGNPLGKSDEKEISKYKRRIIGKIFLSGLAGEGVKEKISTYVQNIIHDTLGTN